METTVKIHNLNIIYTQLMNTDFIPDSLLDNTKENNTIFDLINDILNIFKQLIKLKILSDIHIKEIYKDFDKVLGEIIMNTVDKIKIFDSINFLYYKLGEIKDLALDVELYEICQNIKRFIELHDDTTFA